MAAPRLPARELDVDAARADEARGEAQPGRLRGPRVAPAAQLRVETREEGKAGMGGTGRR